MKRIALATFVVALVMVGVGGALALATSDDTAHACVNDNSGTIQIADECRNGWSPLALSTVGHGHELPEHDHAHNHGVPTYYTRSVDWTVAPGTTASRGVQCDASEDVMTGGGFTLRDLDKLRVISSRPIPGDFGWSVSAQNFALFGDPLGMRTFVRCLDASTS